MLKLEIVTPEKKVVETEADSVTVPTASGDIGLLPNHAPLISAIKPGILAYTRGGTTTQIAIAGGFIEVSRDKVSVLADAAETADEIDPAAIRSSRNEIEKSLEESWQKPIEETEALREQLESANARLRLAGGK